MYVNMDGISHASNVHRSGENIGSHSLTHGHCTQTFRVLGADITI